MAGIREALSPALDYNTGTKLATISSRLRQEVRPHLAQWRLTTEAKQGTLISVTDLGGLVFATRSATGNPADATKTDWDGSPEEMSTA